MADRYWVSNANGTANTAGNWNTAANGTGSAGVPTTNDTVFIGHATTLAANLGNGKCTWDIATTLTAMTVYSGYNSISTTSTAISFTAASTITHADADWDSLGYRVGMKIVVTGATNAGNNTTLTISAIVQNVMTVAETSVVTEAAGASVTVAYTAELDVQADFTLNLLTLDTHILNSSGSGNTITFSGTHAGAGDSRYVLNGSQQTTTSTDLGYSIDGSANGSTATYFDDGNYPEVGITGSTTISFGHKAPTSDEHGKATFASFRTGTSVTTAVDATATPVDNQSRLFVVEAASGFAVAHATFDTGKSTWEFQLDGATFAFPVSDGVTTYNWYNVIISTGTAGRKATVASNRTLSVNSITVKANAVLEGHKTRSGMTSTIVSVRRPKILGAWNFSQISDGIYSSLLETAFPITPAHGLPGRVQLSNGAGAFTSDEKLTWTTATSTLLVDGKLTVTGLIDPTGMEFSAVGSNPGTDAAKTIWVNSGDSNKLYFGSSEVGGGGGSGTVTSVATTAPITGGTITGTGTIGISAATTSAAGSMSGADKTKLDGIETSADVTDAANVTAAGALMDSEVTNLAQVKAFNSADYATAAQGATADTALQTVVVDGVTVIGDGTVANPLVAPPAGGGGSALEFGEWRMVNHNPSTSSSNDFNSNTRWVADLADTNYWTQATTSSDHTSIVLHSDGYLTLAANGIYDVWFSTDIFGHGTGAANIDSFVEISTNNSGDRRYATTREVFRINGVQVKYNHQTTAKIRTGGSAVNIYFSAYLNGCGYYLASYNDYRTSVKVIRLGDA